MSTIQTDVNDILSTFQPAVRKYDLRTAEGKKYRHFTELTEYEVTTGNVTLLEERYNALVQGEVIPVEYPAIRLVRTSLIDDAVVSQYLQLAGTGSKLVVVNEGLWREHWGSGQWEYISATIWTLDESGITKVEYSTNEHYDACKIVTKGLSNKWEELDADIDRFKRRLQEQNERAQRLEDAKASFVPSHSYHSALRNAQEFINQGVQPSKGDNDTWHNHVHVAIDTEVLNLCKHFVEILGKTTYEVHTAFSTYRNGDVVVVIDEHIAYATVVAERTGRSWSSNDFSGALIGEALNRFTRIVRSY